MDVPLVFGLVAIIIVLGFLASYFSRKTGVPDIITLILFGFLVGPVLQVVKGPDLASVAPIFASVTITVILFDGGLRMDLFKVLQQSPRAILLTLLGFSSSLIITSVFTTFFLGWGLLHGLLLGAIVGGTSSAVVLPLVKRANVPERVSTLLTLESAFTDVLVVVFAVGMMHLWVNSSSDGISTIARGVFSGFSVGAVVGIVSGIAWLKVLKHLVGEAYNDILTLGMVLGLYAVSESLGGNGAISALLFGLVLGNGSTVTRMLRMQWVEQAGKIMWRFHGQISFLMRTFFFVYLGIIISLSNIQLLLTGLALSLLLLAGRYLAVVGSSVKEPILQIDRKRMATMMPRGLAAAVLSQLVGMYGIPGASMLSDITISIIISTVLISAIGGYVCTLKLTKPREKATGKNQLQRLAAKMKSRSGEYPTVEQRAGDTPKRLSFRRCIVKCLIDGEFKEQWGKKPRQIEISTVLQEKMRGICPDVYVEYLEERIAIEAKPFSQESSSSLHDILRDLHLTVTVYEKAGFDGELRLVLDDISALRYLRALYKLQQYYVQTQNNRTFTVIIQVLDLNSGRLLPLSGVMGWIDASRTQRTNPLVSLIDFFNRRE